MGWDAQDGKALQLGQELAELARGRIGLHHGTIEVVVQEGLCRAVLPHPRWDRRDAERSVGGSPSRRPSPASEVEDSPPSTKDPP